MASESFFAEADSGAAPIFVHMMKTFLVDLIGDFLENIALATCQHGNYTNGNKNLHYR